MKRRRAIISAVSVSVGLAGCSSLQSRDGEVDVTLFNQTADPYTVEIEFFGDGASEASARAYSESLDLEPDGRETRDAVVESGRYLVRYHAYEDSSTLTDEDHVHYIPSGDRTENLTFDVQEGGEVTRR